MKSFGWWTVRCAVVCVATWSAAGASGQEVPGSKISPAAAVAVPSTAADPPPVATQPGAVLPGTTQPVVLQPGAAQPATPPTGAAQPSTTVPAPSAAPALPADPLDAVVDEAIDISRRRVLSADVHTPWQIMHGVLAFRREFLLKSGEEKINALQWLSAGAKFRGEWWWEKTAYGGRGHLYSTPYAFEGHPNQFSAILTLTDLPETHAFQTAQGPVTIADIVRNAQMEVNPREEITWTLWFLCHYLPPDAQWRNKQNDVWSMERLVQMQTREPVNSAACGGTHGLFALSRARNAYVRRTGQPLRGVWLEADLKIQQYVQVARSVQNPDGSFSNKYFASREYPRDFPSMCATTGHVLEFLAEGVSDATLREQWFRNAVHAMAKGLIDHKKDPLDCGPLYHAVDGLVIYRERTRPQVVTALKPVVPDPVPGSPEETPERKVLLEKLRLADAEAKSAEAAVRAAEARLALAEAELKTLETAAQQAVAALEAKRAEVAAKTAQVEAQRTELREKQTLAESRKTEARNRRAALDAPVER